jgi:hypothetical protein
MAMTSHKDNIQRTQSAAALVHGAILQRKCACGGSSGLTWSCSSCETKKMVGQSLQTKLRVNEPGDGYEQEAERVADRVVLMPASEESENSSTRLTTPLVQRRTTTETRTTGLGEAPLIVHDVLYSPGQPLDTATRAFFEPRFGHNFENVRVHFDAKATESAHAVNALAYTVGQDVVFGPGKYAPQAASGQRLLAHELSHVMQQNGSGPSKILRRTPGSASEPEEASSLATGIAGTHKIVISGEPFDLAVMTPRQSPEDPSAKYRKAAEEYLGSYPNLGGGLWAFIVKPAEGTYCSIGGNCLGWAYGTFDDNDPTTHVWELVPQYLESVDQSVRGKQTPLEIYFKQAQHEKIPVHAIWDYFMTIQFHAVPTDSEGEAHLALYGRGFAGTMDGPSHIAFRTAGEELWVSKPSPSRFPIVHELASQMSGGQMGNVVRLYKRESGPPDHVVLRPKLPRPQP